MQFFFRQAQDLTATVLSSQNLQNKARRYRPRPVVFDRFLPNIHSKIEVLAPCGDYDILIAAVHAGADACYIGGNSFGARAYATNFDEETIKQAFVSMCNKLIQHYREILLPLRRSLQELNMRRFSGNTKILDIHKNIADIKEQRHVLSRLRKKGFMDEKKYNEKLTELESQLARQERELKKTAKADNEDDTLEQLDILIDSIEKQDNITTEFDEELFGIIVERIIVRDKSLEFILISGLSLKEDI